MPITIFFSLVCLTIRIGLAEVQALVVVTLLLRRNILAARHFASLGDRFRRPRLFLLRHVDAYRDRWRYDCQRKPYLSFRTVMRVVCVRESPVASSVLFICWLRFPSPRLRKVCDPCVAQSAGRLYAVRRAPRSLHHK